MINIKDLKKAQLVHVLAGNARHVYVNKRCICGADGRAIVREVKAGRCRGSEAARQGMANSHAPFDRNAITCSYCRMQVESAERRAARAK